LSLQQAVFSDIKWIIFNHLNVFNLESGYILPYWNDDAFISVGLLSQKESKFSRNYCEMG